MVKLPLKTLALWRARLSAVFLLLCAVFTHFFRFLLPAFLIIYLLLFFWYIPSLFKSFQIKLGRNRLELSYGVLLCRKKVCFFARTPVIFAFSSPLAAVLRVELVVLRTTYGFIFLPEAERGAVRECLD